MTTTEVYLRVTKEPLKRFLRVHYAAHGPQVSVRDMIRHFKQVWDDDRASNRYLHELFPQRGPQKRSNRPAVLLRTMGGTDG